MSGTLLQAWAGTLRRHGARRAVVQAADGRTATFRELDVRSRAWLGAHGAGAPGTLAGRAVVFAAPNGLDWFELLLGLLRAGAVAVPLDAGEPPAAQRALAEAIRAGFWWDGVQLVPAAWPERRFRDPHVALIKLTSGSTGRPRPLAFTGAQLLADARQVTSTMQISARDLNYALIPLGHSYGLGNLTLPLLASGVSLVCGAAPLPHAIADDFTRWRPTVFPGVPPLWRALAASGIPPTALRSLRLAISAGAPLPVETAHAFATRFGRRLHAFYGSSETGGIAFDRTGAATLDGGVGRALRSVRLEPARRGRLRVQSAAVFTCGNRTPGCWMPPDRVAIDAEGNVALHGRRGTTVKIAGRRVSLAEVARRLRGLAGVRDAWVGVSTGAEVVLGAALATDRPLAEIRAEFLAGTGAWKAPKKWLLLPALPVTPRGKTDVRALQQRLFASR